jgi:DHA1 family purine ribonucleoside efflux pump-like MFS transporter
VNQNKPVIENPTVTPAKWSAIFAIAFSVGCVITAELLPASLLTPMAAGLGVSTGTAGQTLTATAFVAIFSSLFVSALAGRLDRRLVVMGYSLLLIAANLLAAFGPSFAIVLVGRVLLGIAVGGFWAMAASLTMRLAPPQDVPKALSVVFGGSSVALVIAAPMGSILGEVVGWRGVFLMTAMLGAACLAWQAISLPSMPANDSGRAGAAFAILKRRGVPAAMLAIFAVFAGQFSFFSYMRPFFESVANFDVKGISSLLLLFGIASFAGTSMSSIILKRGLKLLLACAPLVLALCAGTLLVAGASHGIALAITATWGFVFGIVPVSWSTWVTRNLGDDAENAGGLQVAVIQIANAFGAALGGVVLDSSGVSGPIAVSGVLLAATFVIVIACLPTRVGKAAPHQHSQQEITQ